MKILIAIITEWLFVADWCRSFENGDITAVRRGMPRIAVYAVMCVLLILAGAATANAQTSDSVVITREAAIKCLQDQDKLKATEAENAVLRQAVEDYKKINTDLKIELAKLTGEKTGADQMVVRLTAILDIVIPKVRKKSIGVIAF